MLWDLQAVPVNMVHEEFPFHKFFDDAPKPLFKGRSYEEDMEIADGCFRYVMRQILFYTVVIQHLLLISSFKFGFKFFCAIGI